jgi:hypothetical protein
MQAHHDTVPLWLQAACLSILVLAALNIYRRKWRTAKQAPEHE